MCRRPSPRRAPVAPPGAARATAPAWRSGASERKRRRGGEVRGGSWNVFWSVFFFFLGGGCLVVLGFLILIVIDIIKIILLLV